MFSELMHGMLMRTMREAGMDHLGPTDNPIQPELRVGIIPGGKYLLFTILYLVKAISEIYC